MTKRSRNRAFQENTIKKINLVMTPNSDDFGLVPKVSLYGVTTVLQI